MHWRRKWQPTPVFLPGESQGRGSLVGCSPWGRRESDTAEATQQQQSVYIGEGDGTPLHYSCLENPMDGGAWWAAVHGVTQSRTRLKWLSRSGSSSVYLSIVLSQFISPSSPLPSCPHVCSVYLPVYSCTANKFICTIFSRFHIYALIYNICSSLSDLLHSLCMTDYINPHLYKWPNFVPFSGWVIFHCIYVPHLNHSSVDGHLGYFSILVIVNSAAMNNGVYVSFWIMVFSGYMPSNGISG